MKKEKDIIENPTIDGAGDLIFALRDYCYALVKLGKLNPYAFGSIQNQLETVHQTLLDGDEESDEPVFSLM